MKSIKNLISIGGALTALCLTASTQLAAFDHVVELNGSGGWRQDHLRSGITTNINPSSDVIKASHLNIWQIGLQGRIDPEFCECGSWLNNFVLKGSAYWGWVSNGVYRHSIETDPLTGITIGRGDIDHGHTWDYNIGLGYLYPIVEGLRIGPTGGYSMNKLSFKVINSIGVVNTPQEPNEIGQTTNSTINPFSYYDEGLIFVSKWEGPWVGADVCVDMCEMELNLSYEYHFSTHWRGSFNAVPANLTDDTHFSDKRRGNSGFGHVGAIETTLMFCECFNLGLGFKYEYFRVKGTVVPQGEGGFPAVGGPEDEVDRATTTWNSFSVFADLGVVF